MSEPTGGDVVDVPAESRLVLRQGGGTAELVYRRSGSQLVLAHTGVPDELGGQGIGGRLVRAAVGLAARDHLEVAPWCPFARRWLREHPDVTAEVAVDWSPPPGESGPG